MAIAIEVLPIGPVAVACRAWRHRGRRLFTTIVKGTFSLEQDAPMSVLQPVPIVTEERHYRGNPVASLIRASDLALTVPKPEVVIVGSAYAGTGMKSTHTSVRLAVQRDSTIVINKRLEITGDRRAKPGAQPPDPLPFEKMPILYERAKGGIAARDNPVGVGLATDPDGLLTFPNIAPSSQGGAIPAGLGPIPSAWPLRQKKRGSLGWSAANLSPDVDVPDDFDDAYYQTAPADQQTSELRAGDVLAIVNMHPDIGTLRTYLPWMRGVAMAQTARGDRIPLNLRIDTVHIEPDQMRAEIVFRGASVLEERDLVGIRIAGALEQPDAPFSFPDLSTVSGLVMRGDNPTPSFETTAVIGDPLPPAQREEASRSVFGSVPPPALQTGRGTMVMEPEEPRRPGIPSAPTFGPPPAALAAAAAAAAAAATATAAPAPRPPMDSSPERRSSTMVMEVEGAPSSLPFDKRARAAEKGHAISTEATPFAAPIADETSVTLPSTHALVTDDGVLDELSIGDVMAPSSTSFPDAAIHDAPTTQPGLVEEEPTAQPPPKRLDPRAEPADEPTAEIDSAKETPRATPPPRDPPPAPFLDQMTEDSPSRIAVPSTAPSPVLAPAAPRANIKDSLYKKLKK